MSKSRSRLLLSLAFAVIAMCSPILAQNPPRLEQPTHADVKYGAHERQVLDFWRAPGDKPSPVLVHIHGGGFVGGDKRSLSPILLREALASGISVASIHYRFVGKGVTFPAPQQDGARAIQFIRSKSKRSAPRSPWISKRFALW